MPNKFVVGAVDVAGFVNKPAFAAAGVDVPPKLKFIVGALVAGVAVGVPNVKPPAAAGAGEENDGVPNVGAAGLLIEVLMKF